MRTVMNASAHEHQFLAISGSIRAQSVNTAILHALAELSPDSVMVQLFTGLAGLPHFNPDLDTATPPETVVQFRAQVAHADALVLCSPEYAHGVPGVLKNALDWLVSYEPFMNKPVCLINARPRSTWAMASLRETLSVMSARLIEPACIALPLDGNRYDKSALLAVPAVRSALAGVLSALVAAIPTPSGS